MSKAYTRMNLKMSKREKIALIALVAILVGYGIYQTAFATNESDYISGYSDGKTQAYND